MKTWGVFCSCMLLCCNVALAALNVSDNFNDGVVNPGLWDDPLLIPGIVEDTLTETNGHLHFSCTNDPGRAILPWKSHAPFDLDWEVKMTVTLPGFENNTEQQYDMALELSPHSTEQVISNRAVFGMSRNEANQKVFFENFVTNSTEVHDRAEDRLNDTAMLRMRWLSASSNLYADVSTDGGTTWTNYWEPISNPFSMSSSDRFSCQIYGGSTGREISISDNLYCDDFQATIYSGPLSGSDDFNDNIRDTSKWLEAEPLLTETNNRLEFTTSGIGDENGTWVWVKNAGSYTQDWAVTIDAYNSSTTSNQWSFTALGILAPNVSEGPLLSVGISSEDETDRGIVAGWEEGMSEHYIWHSTTNYAAKLSLSYDALTKELSSAYNLGNGFITLTNRNIGGLAMGTNDSFMIILAGSTENSFLIESGEMYFDNFEATTLPGISNHLSGMSVDYTYKAANPVVAGDEYYSFRFEAQTDASVTSVYVQCPSGHGFNSGIDEIGEDTIYWETTTNSSSDFFDLFGNGDYTVTLLYTNGSMQSTILPYAQADSITPIPTLTQLPAFTLPSPLHEDLFVSPEPVSMAWTNIDPNANAIEVELYGQTTDAWHGYYFTDTVAHPYFSPASGPLSTRTLDSLSLTQDVWEAEIEALYDVHEINVDGVHYNASWRVETYYTLTVLDPDGDYDGDGLSNGWEDRYFDGPSNAIASADSDLDGHNNLEESITGMDPTNAASCFTVTNSMPLADDFLIEWTSVSGRIYNVNWTTNLMNSFLPLETNIYYPRNNCTDTVHGAKGQCFYQVDVRRDIAAGFDIEIYCAGQDGSCIADASGLSLIIGENHYPGPDLIYAEEYWGEYPMYIPGNTADIDTFISYNGPTAQENITVETATYILNTDGSNGLLINGPNHSGVVSINKGEAEHYITSYVIPMQPKGLYRFIAKLYHKDTLVLTKEAIFCPPDLEDLE